MQFGKENPINLTELFQFFSNLGFLVTNFIIILGEQMKYFLVLIIMFFGLSSLYSQDTFSICAVDTVTGEVGSAGASCLDESDIHGGCSIISDVFPGLGVIHTQAQWSPDNQYYAHELILKGLLPSQIIDSLIANDVNNNPGIRQYGIAALYKNSALVKGYTGSNCMDYKNHIEGKNYCIQGNILLGRMVLDSMEARFLRAEGDLACKLMAAMQGAKMVGADSRCAPSSNSSLSSFIRVAKPGDSQYDLWIDIIVPIVPSRYEPIDSLQIRLDAVHECNPSGIETQSVQSLVEIIRSQDNRTITFKPDLKIINTSVTFEMFDILGHPVFSATIEGSSTFTFENAVYNNGVYFYRLITGGKLLKADKLVLN